MKEDYKHIVVLTGAGVSKESGLDTFRDAEGLWAKHRIEDVCTPEALERNPKLVNDFYNARRAQLSEVQPNAAHRALADLQMKFPGVVRLVTQNVDDLHERGGSEDVVHMHGELNRVECQACGVSMPWAGDVQMESACPKCHAVGRLRPHIVFFGEVPLYMGEIMAWLSSCDLFVAIGTSGNVYPAAGFVELASQSGAHTVELNLEPSQGATLFAEKIYGSASQIVPEFCRRLLKAD